MRAFLQFSQSASDRAKVHKRSRYWFIFPDNKAYDLHVKEKHFPCDLCSSVLKTQNTLTKHKRLYHERNFHCNYCDESFPTVRALTLHRSIYHENNEEHVCDLCGKVFRKICNLRKHKTQVHTNPLQCDLCKCEFRSKYKLRSHIAKEHSENCCNFCGYGFLQKKDLFLHQDIHCKKSFKCEHCELEFSSSVLCNKHMLKNHGRLGFQIEAVPTQCSVRKFVNRLKFLYEPWREDINAIHGEHFF